MERGSEKGFLPVIVASFVGEIMQASRCRGFLSLGEKKLSLSVKEIAGWKGKTEGTRETYATSKVR